MKTSQPFSAPTPAQPRKGGNGSGGITVAERGGGNIAVASRSAMKGNSPSTAGEGEGKL